MKTSLIALSLVVAACGGSKGDAPPPKPFTGAPLAFEVKSLKAGKGFDGEVKVRAYNFSDKTIAGYHVMMRFYDAKGTRIAERPDSPFDYESMSWMGPRDKCAPKGWCDLTIETGVPEGAVKAEVFAKSLQTVQADGITMDKEPLFELEGMKWPVADAAAKPAATN